MLMIFGGLPATGKTTIARSFAARIAATYLRIDSIGQSILGSAWGKLPIDDVGYRVAYAVAADNLRLGTTVIADSVNPLSVTREAWIAVANRAGAKSIEVEIICSDTNLHRQRLKNRSTHSADLHPLSWQEVVSREYHLWESGHTVIDTAKNSVDESVQILLAVLDSHKQ
ncbi:MAG: AAA family ATPase [Acidobacteriia bacterium]|nr:AAA family ATPase [Terriglobia bacterium]